MFTPALDHMEPSKSKVPKKEIALQMMVLCVYKLIRRGVGKMTK